MANKIDKPNNIIRGDYEYDVRDVTPSHKTKLAHYLHKIKNMRRLTLQEMCEINTMEFADRLRVIRAYNEMLDCVQIFINEY